MFRLFHKKNDEPVDFSGLVADMHSHLIPGIDDGSTDLETSIVMIRAMYELGYRKLITTPHVQLEMYKNNSEIIRNGEHKVRERLKGTEMKLEFRAAAEYYLDEYVDELLEKNEPLLTISGNLVLVEFSFIRQPLDLRDKLFQLQIKGYQPIIAHPERYLYFGAHKEFYDELHDMGCIFQLNLLSLCGYYGKKQLELANYLIKKDYVSLLGSDLHNQRHINILRASSSISNTAKKLLDAGKLLNPEL
ncbi:MAG TPA: CpsB/CapC family capsule biosynthesis tyrosine phosphatase [Puia sp.]|jgi:tyrosine-protein phosphatase YwqE|nr:CpsB/CapC family capsule biosynthesis tyrosine phosphatase [Puia sp.]